MEEQLDERFEFSKAGEGAVLKRGRTRTKEEWIAIIQELKSSGESIEEFSKLRGIKSGTLKKHLYKPKARLTKTKSSVDETKVIKQKYLEIKIPEIQAEYEIGLSNGSKLKLRGNFREPQVKLLIELLESRC